jgi:hypothetical protein
MVDAPFDNFMIQRRSVVFGTLFAQASFLAACGGGTASTPAPTPQLATTIFGFNTALGSRLTQNEMDERIRAWGANRVPCGRGYYGTASLPGDASYAGFENTNGKEFKLAGLHLSDIFSSKRVNVCMDVWGDGTVQRNNQGNPTHTYTADEAQVRLEEVVRYAMLMPQGWTIWMGHHEYNGDWTSTTSQAEIDAHVLAQYKIAWAMHDAFIAKGQEPRAWWVVNVAGGGIKKGAWNISMAPPAIAKVSSLYPRGMPPGTLLLSDNYDNPKGTGGLRGYATSYGDSNNSIAEGIDEIFKLADELGYTTSAYGWGIGEFNSPQRVAPKVSGISMADRTKLGWPDPVSGLDADVDGVRRAAAIKYYIDYCKSRPVPPKLVLLWVQEDGANWNQGISTVGAARYDAWIDGSGVLQSVPLALPTSQTDPRDIGLSPHPVLNQGWPKALLPADTSAMYSMYRAYLLESD